MNRKSDFEKLAGILRKYANPKLKEKEIDVAWSKFAKEWKNKHFKR